jgi:hypothetical protein
MRKKLLAIVSIVLVATAISLAVRGRFVYDRIARTRQDLYDGQIGFRSIGVHNYADAFAVYHQRSAWTATYPTSYWKRDKATYSQTRRIDYFDQTLTMLGDGESRRYRMLFVKHWVLITVTSALALLLNWKAWRRRPGPGHCQQCGYDLRASPQRCPECGRAAGTYG